MWRCVARGIDICNLSSSCAAVGPAPHDDHAVLFDAFANLQHEAELVVQQGVIELRATSAMRCQLPRALLQKQYNGGMVWYGMVYSADNYTMQEL